MSDLDDSDDDERVPLFNETKNVKQNTQKWINQTKNHIKKYCKYERHEYSMNFQQHLITKYF